MIHLLLLLSFSLVALGQENSAEPWKMETMLVSLNGKLAEVKMAFSEVIVYKIQILNWPSICGTDG